MDILPGRRPAVSPAFDSSAAFAWICSQETTDAVRRIFDMVAENGASVPALCCLEVINSLTVNAACEPGHAAGRLINEVERELKAWPGRP